MISSLSVWLLQILFCGAVIATAGLAIHLGKSQSNMGRTGIKRKYAA